jgi:two-component system, NtrC family, sensor kinase
VTKPVEPQELIARARAQIQLRQLYRENLANQALALHAQKLAAVSQLSATLAHELNTPAQYLSDNLAFLTQSFAELVRALGERTSSHEDVAYLQTEIPNSLNDMREGVFRISSIVQTISEFAEGDQHRITSVDLPRAIGRVVELLRSRWLGLVELSAHHSPNVHNVHCGPADLKHALWQLIAQAIDEASAHALNTGADKGRVDIATRRDPEGVMISVRATRPTHKRSETVPPSDPDVLRVTRAVLHRQHAELTRQIEADGSSTTIIRLPA